MKITMYELLGLVKDGKTPKKIKYDGQEYKITKILLEDSTCYVNYINEDMECIFPINTNHLNEKVEILEEEKKDNFTGWKMYQDGKEVCSMDCSVEEKKIPEKLNKQHFHNRQRQLANKINEIIDYLKSKGDE